MVITAPAIIHKLVETFEKNLDEYRSSKNEPELCREFLKKFFAAPKDRGAVFLIIRS
jgi:hypothetical protein